MSILHIISTASECVTGGWLMSNMIPTATHNIRRDGEQRLTYQLLYWK